MATSHGGKEPDLLHSDWYHGLLPRADIIMLLKRNGDYLVRMTEPLPGEPRKYVLSVMKDESKEEEGIKHVILRQNGQKFIGEFSFDSIPALIAYHARAKTFKYSNELTLSLLRPIGRQSWELSHDDITCHKKVGEGAFGEVHIGELRRRNLPPVKAAIKLAKLESLTKEQIKEIMSEARLMRNFDHENVVAFFGVSAGQEPLMVVMGFASNGSLDSYLQKAEQPMNVKNEMVMQAAWGVDYIHYKNVLHRDLACRNCLYGDGKVKIADFGLSREGTVYQMDPHKKVPIRWLAPEVITSASYSQKTDVWAYGVMVWEIYHNGTEPYAGRPVIEVAMGVKNDPNFRCEFVENSAPPEIMKLVKEKCWSQGANGRFSMPELVKHLQRNFGLKPPPKEGGGGGYVPGGVATPSSQSRNDPKQHRRSRHE